MLRDIYLSFINITHKEVKSNNPVNKSLQKSHPQPIEFHHDLVIKLLDNLYPIYCCNSIVSKPLNSRPNILRCSKCHKQHSRLAKTPLKNLKLPLWMFGFVIYESIYQYPKVLTSIEISKKLGISYQSARILKQRFQIFASEQLENIKPKLYSNLSSTTNSKSNNTTKNEVHADTFALYSASQRANKGRKRHKNGGLTASIYLSDALGGKQVGILVHTLAFSNGGFLCHSIPDLKMDTIGNIFREYVPNDANVRTDEGYKFLTGIYKNHRMINHSLKSKDKRYRYSKDRWCNDGIHNQIAEGTQSVIKTAFRNYRYIRPEYSQLYLNEYSFISNIRSYGIGILIEQENVNKVAKRYLSHNLINQSS